MQHPWPLAKWTMLLFVGLGPTHGGGWADRGETPLALVPNFFHSFVGPLLVFHRMVQRSFQQATFQKFTWNKHNNYRCVYIYIERERGREMCVCVCSCEMQTQFRTIMLSEIMKGRLLKWKQNPYISVPRRNDFVVPTSSELPEPRCRESQCCKQEHARPFSYLWLS